MTICDMLIYVFPEGARCKFLYCQYCLLIPGISIPSNLNFELYSNIFIQQKSHLFSHYVVSYIFKMLIIIKEIVSRILIMEVSKYILKCYECYLPL